MIYFVKGDATQPQRKPAVIVHVLNNLGGWGAGFSGAISKRWRGPEGHYRTQPRSALQLGNVQIVSVEPEIYVAGIVAQVGYRGPGNMVPLDYGALATGLRDLAEEFTNQPVSMHMPRIGCGLAGGDWQEVEPILERTLVAKLFPVYVYDL